VARDGIEWPVLGSRFVFLIVFRSSFSKEIVSSDWLSSKRDSVSLTHKNRTKLELNLKNHNKRITDKTGNKTKNHNV
jgi:hypothetical protein